MKLFTLPFMLLFGYYTTSDGMLPSTCEICNGQLGKHSQLLSESFGRDSIQGQLLILATIKGNNERVQEILQGISDEKLDEIIKNEFDGNSYTISYLLSKLLTGGDPYPYEETALLCASQYGYVKIIKQLLAFRTNINAQCDDNLFTPLMCATDNGHLETVRLLIQNGANLKLRDVEQKTALDHAQEMYQQEQGIRRYEIVKLLEEAESKEIEQSWRQHYSKQENLPD